MRSVSPILMLGIFEAIFAGSLLAQSVQEVIYSNPAINTIVGIVGSNTAFAMKDNATTTTPSTNNTHNSTAAANNVTAASGNNGHIYRGGAAAGSGGE